VSPVGYFTGLEELEGPVAILRKGWAEEKMMASVKDLGSQVRSTYRSRLIAVVSWQARRRKAAWKAQRSRDPP
jgi:hypothetical protein